MCCAAEKESNHVPCKDGLLKLELRYSGCVTAMQHLYFHHHCHLF